MNKLSVIIPVYYNADSLRLLYADMKEKALPYLEDYEIVMVDDGSADDSWAEMQGLAELDSKIKLIRLSRNFGSHAAILAGLSNCTGDCATVKAADLQEPSEMITEMYRAWKDGNKVVLAVRTDRNDGVFQSLFANFYYFFVRKLVLKTMPKGGFDCYLIDRKVIEVLKLLDEKNSAVTLQVLWAGFKTGIVRYARKKREIGRSRWTFAKKVKLTIDSIVSFSFVPIRFMSVVGVLFFIISIIWGIGLILYRIFGNLQVQGWTTLMVVLLFSAGLIMMTLGILGEYIWRATDAARNRPVYIIDEIKGNGVPENPDGKPE